MSVYRAMVAFRTHVGSGDCPLSPTARLLWATLAAHADYDGACWPDVATLSHALGGVSRWTVQRAAAELVAYGVLDVLVAHGRGRRNTYRLELAPEENGARVHRFPKGDEAAENGARVHGLPACGYLENGAPVLENGAPVHPHIGEVEKRSRRDASTSTIEETPHPCTVSTEADPAAYRAYRKRMAATGGQVMPAWYYFTVPRDADGNPVNTS